MSDRPIFVELEVTEDLIAEKVDAALQGEAFEKVINDLAQMIFDNKTFRKSLKEKITKEINKQLAGKIEDFVKDIRLDC